MTDLDAAHDALADGIENGYPLDYGPTDVVIWRRLVALHHGIDASDDELADVDNLSYRQGVSFLDAMARIAREQNGHARPVADRLRRGITRCATLRIVTERCWALTRHIARGSVFVRRRP